MAPGKCCSGLGSLFLGLPGSLIKSPAPPPPPQTKKQDKGTLIGIWLRGYQVDALSHACSRQRRPGPFCRLWCTSALRCRCHPAADRASSTTGFSQGPGSDISSMSALQLISHKQLFQANASRIASKQYPSNPKLP